MKELIIQALDEAFIKFEKTIPQTKKQEQLVSIVDINPLDIAQFMKDNDIPSNAYFTGRDNGYDAWDDICLGWEIDVPTTEKEKLKYKKRTFTNYAFQSVRKLLLENGYKNVGYSTRLLYEFDDTTVYEMYINKDFDRLVKYYSLPFVVA